MFFPAFIFWPEAPQLKIWGARIRMLHPVNIIGSEPVTLIGKKV